MDDPEKRFRLTVLREIRRFRLEGATDGIWISNWQRGDILIGAPKARIKEPRISRLARVCASGHLPLHLGQIPERLTGCCDVPAW